MTAIAEAEFHLRAELTLVQGTRFLEGGNLLVYIVRRHKVSTSSVLFACALTLEMLSVGKRVQGRFSY